MKLELLTVCDYAADMGGKLVIVGTFDVIFAQQVPHGIQMGIAIKFRPEAKDGQKSHHDIEVRVKGPDGKQIAEMQGSVDRQVLPGTAPDDYEKAPFQLAFTVPQAVFTAYGKHVVEAWLDKSRVHAIPVWVQHPPTQPGVQVPPLPHVPLPGGKKR